MFAAVRHGSSKYSQQQRQAWVPYPRTGVEWQERLDSQLVVVAEVSTQIVGFMSLADDGYIEFSYIRPVARRTGLFRRLYVKIEKYAQKNSESRLWVHASLMAQPAFAAMGFVVSKSERVPIGEEVLKRFEMGKTLIQLQPK